MKLLAALSIGVSLLALPALAGEPLAAEFQRWCLPPIGAPAAFEARARAAGYVDPPPAFLERFRGAFPGMPVVLMGQDARGQATYFGRRDIVNFLSNVSPSRIPWRRYTLN